MFLCRRITKEVKKRRKQKAALFAGCQMGGQMAEGIEMAIKYGSCAGCVGARILVSKSVYTFLELLKPSPESSEWHLLLAAEHTLLAACDLIVVKILMIGKDSESLLPSCQMNYSL